MPAWQASAHRRCRDAHSRRRRQHHQRSEAAAHAQPVDRRGDDAGGGAAGRRRPAGAQLRAAAVRRSGLLCGRRCRRSASSLPDARYRSPLQRQAFIETLLARAATDPNVESAGAVFGLPLSNFRFGISTSTRDGVTLSDDEQDAADAAGPAGHAGLLQDDGHSDRQGPRLHVGDRMGSQPVAMLNQTGAARVWPDQDAIGHQLRDRHAARAWAAIAPAAR